MRWHSSASRGLGRWCRLATALLAVATVPAEAQEQVSVTVRTAGLELGSPAGQRALDLRILHAARTVCGTPSSVDPGGWRKHAACRADAQARAHAARNRALALAQVRRVGEEQALALAEKKRGR